MKDSENSSQKPKTSQFFMKKINEYILLEVLGEGGMGTVYRGLHPKTGETVAIKVSPVLKESEAARIQNREKNFLREIKVMTTLQHPHITRILDSGWSQEGNQLYLVMEYIKGDNLSSWMEKKGPVSLQESILITYKISLALEYLHSQKIVHRDLKPSNILMDEQDMPRINDFGFAQIREGETTTVSEPGKIIGSLAYMSPEQMESNILSKVGYEADIYSLGTILFELLTGQRAFRGSTVEIITQKFNSQAPRIRRILPEIPAEIDEICSKMISLYPQNRYNATEVRILLEEWQNKYL